MLGAVGETNPEPPPPLSRTFHRVRKNKGRWTHEEHLAFLRGLHLYDKTWEAIASLVPTRTVLQIRTHSQKYFSKIESGGVFPEEVRPFRVQHAVWYVSAVTSSGLRVVNVSDFEYVRS